MPPPQAHGDISPPALVLARYIYPLFLFVFFLSVLTTWGILTSESSKPTPPPVTAVLNGDASRRRRSRRNSLHSSGDGETLWARIAACFPGGLPDERKNMCELGLIGKAAMNWLMTAVLVTFVANSANVILHALMVRGWWCGRDYVISTVSLLFVYALLLILQVDDDLAPSFPHFSSWLLGLAGEFLLLAIGLRTVRKPLDSWSAIDIAIGVLRALLLLLLVTTYTAVILARRRCGGTAEETTGLLSDQRLPEPQAEANGNADYGSLSAGQKSLHGQKNVAPGWARKTVVGKQSWWEYLRGYAIFFPYLWPGKDRRLQLLIVVCLILVLLQRVINVLVPHQLGKVTDTLSGENGPPRLPWVQITLYIVFRFLQGNMGLLGAIRSTLWIPIGQYSYQALSTSAFEHVHSLSLDFHLGKKTGEVLSALSKGNSINSFLEQVTFQVLPMLIDLGVAVGYFFIEFDSYYALIVGVITFCYLYLTVRMAQWRADIRREMVNKSREEYAVKNDSMVAYETVKYFNAEQYEFGRYRDAVKAYQRAEYRALLSLNAMNVTQNVLFTLGVLVSCYLSAYQVTTGQVKVGRFVALLAYLAQLQGPLNFFGTFYRSIQSSMINAERMLELFKEKPTVTDAPHAKLLQQCNGEVLFRDVHFSYDQRKPALAGLSFTAAPGSTTAFVGESGGGKTTILRLLFRFYNVQSGGIFIDDHDVRDITIDSVRSQIGVVPQDTVLFNETVMYNLKYANPDATDEMVYEACKAAAIHEKILGFPDGYQTKVGERGLRLSGGEKQRVAIARTILKNPKIILLDEATASLDSSTEGHIQAALSHLSRGRTTLVIAHRLSTIVGADQILCIHDGCVVERGTHEQLMTMGGRYRDMWEKQVKAERVEKAKRRLEVGDSSPESGLSREGSVLGGDNDSQMQQGQNLVGANAGAMQLELAKRE